MRVARLIFVSVVAVALAMAGGQAEAGGGATPPSFVPVISGPAISAVILMDPHMAGVTPNAKQATIWLRSGTLTSQASFVIPEQFLLYRGCDLARTNDRFLHTALDPNNLTDWVPPFVLESLFLPFGVTVSSTTIPAITQIGSATCLSDPAFTGQPPVIADGGDGQASLPGWLQMQATIQFLVPSKK